jgi:FlaG/FlaF family flagellin (archaellin)
MSLPERAVSSVVGTVLLIALAAVLATGVLAAGSAMNSLADPPPTVVVDADEISAACAGCGPRDQVVRLTHQSGDAVSMADSSIVVSVPTREQTGRLVALPLALNCLRDSHVDGTDLFDGRCGRVSGAVTAVGTDADGVWRAGESLSFRLRKSAVRLAPDDDVVVRLRHVPSGTVVTEVEPAVVG